MEFNNKWVLLIFTGMILVTGVLATNYFTDTKLTSGATIINYTTPDTSIKLYSQAHTAFGNDNGESIEFWGLSPMAKPYLGWYAYDLAEDDIEAVGWIGCHYNLTNGDTHSHCSWETLDATGVNSHFEITYNSSQARANIKFPTSDVQFISNQKLYFGDNKNIYIQHNASSGNLDLKGNAKVLIETSSGLDMNNKATVNQSTLKFQLTSLPTCNAGALGTFAVNTTGSPHYCNSTNWRALSFA